MPGINLTNHRVLTHEEQVALAKRVASGDERARKAMVQANMRLVAHWARRYQGSVDYDDLVQEGTLGLIRAVDKFEWERGFRFSTYATWWIRQAMQRAVERRGAPGVSLDQPVAEDESTSLGELVDTGEPSFEAEVDEQVARANLRHAIGRLDEMERRVVALRFGLDGFGPASLETVASRLGVGVRRVRRLERSALERLGAMEEVSALGLSA